MSYKNLIKITSYLEEFEAINKEDDFTIERFSYWLSEKVSNKPHAYNKVKTDIKNPVFEQTPDVQISILIGRMGKYARVYTKRILQNKNLSGLDDYTFMATLMFRESMTKSELIHHNLMDSVTSGADIIKRLVKSNYIEEFDDDNDKRSKRVRITQAGKILMFEVFSEMNVVANIITGNLNGDEKLFLLSYLKKLDHFHENIYRNDRKLELEQIQEKYL